MSNIERKIAINASFLRKPDSGIGQVTLNFIKKLSELKGDNGELKFILYLEEDSNLSLPGNFEKRILTCRFYQRDDLVRKIIWEKWLLPRAIKKDGCQMLFSLYQSSTVFKSGKHLMLVHDAVWKIFPEYLNNCRKKIYYYLVDRAIKKADKILTVSENSRCDLVKYLKVEKNKLDVAWIDCDPIYKKKVLPEELKRVLQKYNLERNSKYIFYVGGFDARKNLSGLIDSYGELSKLMTEDDLPELVLAGQFNAHLVPLVTDLPRKISETAKKYGFSMDKIRQIGFVEQVDLPAFYSGAELFCYPSIYEGFGVPPLEAQNAGCPLIILRNSSLQELFDNKGAAVINENNPEKIAQAMKEILTDREVREKLAQAGKENAKRFSWEKFTAHFLKIATTLIFNKK